MNLQCVAGTDLFTLKCFSAEANTTYQPSNSGYSKIMFGGPRHVPDYPQNDFSMLFD